MLRTIREEIVVVKTYYRSNTHITEWGDHDHPVIFCLHGLGSTALSFIEIAEELKGEFRIIAVDAPGHGRTVPFANPADYEMPRMAEWLEGVIQALKLEDFYFLSHSWGSFAHLFYLFENRDKVRGSILIDGGYQAKSLGNISEADEVAYYRKDFEDSWSTWDEFLNEAVYSGSRRSGALDRAGEDLALMKDGRYYWHARGETGAAYVMAMHRHEVLEHYDRLPRGIVLLRATLPPQREENRIHMATLFKDGAKAIVKDIPQAAHLIHWDRPDVIVNEIRESWGKKDDEN
ncbi:alpha/beta hydrolase [Rossellomorea marisflavi]|uniref:Alpha/beta hydrolase n=1 Tax=Rossellomorea marisflavi TaxID=189381 RepID=A0A5D4RNR4_9BACI|nr:alpha/beta hydrolase [Rossellomorea marisflavi]